MSEGTADISKVHIDDLLRFMVQQEASDLHLKPMRPPLIRLNGKLLPLKLDALPPETLHGLLDDLLNDYMRKKLQDQMAIDFGYSLRGVSRFRASVFYQRGTMSAVFRRVPFDFPTLEDWGFPTILNTLSEINQGLVLITGPTGSGKSSTLAALMKLIASTRLVHIVTIEDPIEFLLRDGKAAVTQREVGTDTPSFSEALRNAMRQDPDVIMVGEMRDTETMQTVLTAAETGHLVFSTLHTNSAAQTIDRIIDAFDEGHHRQIRQQLSAVLKAVVSLKLVEKVDGSGLIAAVEILLQTPRVSKLILEGNLDALYEEMENSVAYHKMQSMNQSLAALVLQEAVTKRAALNASQNASDLDLLLRKTLFAAEEAAHSEDAMAEPLSDYSTILELQEIRKLYEEQQERHRSEIDEREQQIATLRAQLESMHLAPPDDRESSPLQAENERLAQQIQLVRQEYENKIERLNSRIRDLSGSGSASPEPAREPERRGFFRR